MEVKERLAIQVYMERAAVRYAKRIKVVEQPNTIEQNNPIGNKNYLMKRLTSAPKTFLHHYIKDNKLLLSYNIKEEIMELVSPTMIMHRIT